jgi:hypothetical protein
MHPDGMDVGNDSEEAQDYLKKQQELLAKLKVSFFFKFFTSYIPHILNSIFTLRTSSQKRI